MHNRYPLISVIMPVYNVEKFLAVAVKSIYNQTYKNIEMILVNDGSEDCSGALCDRFARENSRIRVIHQGNLGVSAARNAGIAASAGDYLFFLDPDDTIEPETLQIMLETMLDQQCDLVICGVRKIFVDEYGQVSSQSLIDLGMDGFISNVDIITKLRSGNINEVDYCASACNRLYKRSLCVSKKDPFPVDLRYCEDVYFSAEVLNDSSAIYCIRNPFYNYYRYHVKLRKSSMNSHVEHRFDIYKKLHLKIYRTLKDRVDKTELARCKHNFIDRVVLACVDLCRPKSPFRTEEIVEELNRIVNDESVIDALKYYNHKARYNCSNSWTIPLLIQLKRVDYLMRFARKVARIKFG